MEELYARPPVLKINRRPRKDGQLSFVTDGPLSGSAFETSGFWPMPTCGPTCGTAGFSHALTLQHMVQQTIGEVHLADHKRRHWRVRGGLGW
jgi:hypothetical protein